MNPQAFDANDDLRQLDLLVDGALPEGERRELLARLERQPDGWRRLALAFLEAQTWGEAARAEAQDDARASRAVRPAESPAERTPNWKLWVGTPLAMAASFLVAFTLGMLLRGAWRDSEPNASLLAAGQSAQAESAARNAIAQAEVQLPEGWTFNDEVQYFPAGPELAAAGEPEADPVEEVWLPADTEPSAESSLAGTPAPAVPEQVLRSLRRLGHQVNTRQALWPVDLQNGQRAIVPVDEVEIRYVGNDYQ